MMMMIIRPTNTAVRIVELADVVFAECFVDEGFIGG